MPLALQFDFPFASLDFPGRTVLYPHEIAGEKGRAGMSFDQFYRLVDEGVICAIDIARAGVTRRELRVPIEAWRNFVVSRMTGPMQRDFLRALPAPVREQLIAELIALRGV